MVMRMFYNPNRNEALFVASCAERLIKNEREYGAHSISEIFARIEEDVSDGLIDNDGRYIQFRLAFITRQNGKIKRNDGLGKHILFTSRVKELNRLVTS